MAKSQPDKNLIATLAWSALEYVGKKRADRSLIEPGATKIALDVTGLVGRSKFTDTLAGQLILSEPTQAASTQAAPIEHIISALFTAAKLDDNQKAKAMAHVIESFESDKLAEGPDHEHVKAFLKRCRSTRTVTKAGNLTFNLDTK
jgi:hypothetical protein